MCSDITLSVYPRRAGCKIYLTTVGMEPATFGSIPTVVRQIFQPARCGYTLRETLLHMFKLNNLQGPVVRRVDNAIHRIAIFSTFPKLFIYWYKPD